jgi:hypothetical protein
LQQSTPTPTFPLAMAVSDLAGQPKPKPDWLAIRHEYEHGSIGYRRLAKAHGISPSTVTRRMRVEGWIQRKRIARAAIKSGEAKIIQSLRAKAEQELAPWLEAEKVKFTRKGVRVARVGMSRVERMFRQQQKPDPKSEAFISKAAETYHRVGRVALGMSDGTAPVMPLNLAILGNHTAVQIVRQGPESESQD